MCTRTCSHVEVVVANSPISLWRPTRKGRILGIAPSRYHPPEQEMETPVPTPGVPHPPILLCKVRCTTGSSAQGSSVRSTTTWRMVVRRAAASSHECDEGSARRSKSDERYGEMRAVLVVMKVRKAKQGKRSHLYRTFRNKKLSRASWRRLWLTRYFRCFFAALAPRFSGIGPGSVAHERATTQ